MSTLETFSDEVFFEIFDRLSPSDLYRTFYGLNNRLNTILNDSRMRFRDNLSALSPAQFHSYVQNILPQIIDRLVSFTFGTYDTDEVRRRANLSAALTSLVALVPTSGSVPAHVLVRSQSVQASAYPSHYQDDHRRRVTRSVRTRSPRRSRQRSLLRRQQRRGHHVVRAHRQRPARPTEAQTSEDGHVRSNDLHGRHRRVPGRATLHRLVSNARTHTSTPIRAAPLDLESDHLRTAQR